MPKKERRKAVKIQLQCSRCTMPVAVTYVSLWDSRRDNGPKLRRTHTHKLWARTSICQSANKVSSGQVRTDSGSWQSVWGPIKTHYHFHFHFNCLMRLKLPQTQQLKRSAKHFLHCVHRPREINRACLTVVRASDASMDRNQLPTSRLANWQLSQRMRSAGSSWTEVSGNSLWELLCIRESSVAGLASDSVFLGFFYDQYFYDKWFRYIGRCLSLWQLKCCRNMPTYF